MFQEQESTASLIYKLQTIEKVLQDQSNNAEQLKNVVNDLHSIIQELDKDMVIHSEKQSHLYYRVEQLQKEVELLEQSGEKNSNRQRELMEKVLMAFLGGLITYIYSISTK